MSKVEHDATVHAPALVEAPVGPNVDTRGQVGIRSRIHGPGISRGWFFLEHELDLDIVHLVEVPERR